MKDKYNWYGKEPFDKDYIPKLKEGAKEFLEELNKSADDIICNRHTADKECRAHNLDDVRTGIGQDDSVHIVQAGIAPHTAVKPESNKNK